MRVGELFEHFMSRANWVDPKSTADGIEVGTPDQPVTRIGTGWSACLANLNAAAADGCDLFISHEPSFCEFWEPDAGFRESEWGQARTAVVEGHAMALMALHDIWDNWPTYGIRDSWLRFLGFDRPETFRNYHGQENQWLSLNTVQPTTVRALAEEMAERLKVFGNHGVGVMGDPQAPVQKVAVGVGCGIPTFEMLELGADVLVQVFDRAFQTMVRLPLLDLGANLIVLEHGAAEMCGMRDMVTYLQETFSDIPASFYCQEPQLTWVSD